jgi:hypothetical protein
VITGYGLSGFSGFALVEIEIHAMSLTLERKPLALEGWLEQVAMFSS